MLADGYRVLFHSIDYHKRIGKSKIVSRNFMDFVILVIRLAVLFQPLRVFLPLAFFCGFLGAGKAVFDLILFILRISGTGSSSLFSAPIISTSSILFLLASLQLVLIGMVTDALLNRFTKQNRDRVPAHGIWTEGKEFQSREEQADVIEMNRIQE